MKFTSSISKFLIFQRRNIMSKVIRYLRKESKEKGYKGVPFGVIVALSPDKIGWSICCNEDNWNKNLALRIAEGRAKSDRIGYKERLDKIDIVGSKIKILLNELTKIIPVIEKYDFSRCA